MSGHTRIPCQPAWLPPHLWITETPRAGGSSVELNQCTQITSLVLGHGGRRKTCWRCRTHRRQCEENFSIRSWPPDLRCLETRSPWNHPIRAGDLPHGLEICRFHEWHRASIGRLPTTLTHLHLRTKRRKRLPSTGGTTIEDSQQTKRLHWSLDDDKFFAELKCLQVLELGDGYRGACPRGLASTLRVLHFGDGFNAPLEDRLVDLSALEELEFGNAFAHPVEKENLPPDLRFLTLGAAFRANLVDRLPSEMQFERLTLHPNSLAGSCVQPHCLPHGDLVVKTMGTLAAHAIILKGWSCRRLLVLSDILFVDDPWNMTVRFSQPDRLEALHLRLDDQDWWSENVFRSLTRLHISRWRIPQTLHHHFSLLDHLIVEQEGSEDDEFPFPLTTEFQRFEIWRRTKHGGVVSRKAPASIRHLGYRTPNFDFFTRFRQALENPRLLSVTLHPSLRESALKEQWHCSIVRFIERDYLIAR